MRNETDCTQDERFLFSLALLSDVGIEEWKKNTINRFTNRDKDNFYYKFIDWKRESNEIAVYTLYAYADLEILKEFNCIFNLENPEEYVFANYKITQSIYEGWLPTNMIDAGHKHLLVFKFENELPNILSKLNKVNSLKDLNIEVRTRLGFCDKEDFEKISDRLKETISLKKKHGSEWWKYDSENL